MMLALLLANVLDLTTFLAAASALPIEGEANPLARTMYSAFGPPGVVVLKVAGVSLALFVLAGIADSPGKSVVIALMVAFALFGAFTNVFALWRFA